MITRAKRVAGLATLVLASATSGVALGDGSYSVTLKGVPPKGGAEQGKVVHGMVEATGPVGGPYAFVYVAAYASETTACAATIEEETKLALAGKAHNLTGFTVDTSTGKGDKPYSLTPKRAGTEHVCAYVYKHVLGKDTLAKAHASFPVRPARPGTPAPPTPPKPKS